MCFRPRRPSSCSSTIRLKRPAVNHAEVTLCLRMVSLISGRVGFCCGCSTRRPPFNRAPQISNVLASNEMFESWRKVRSGPKGRKFCSRTRRTTARCGTTTPLGRPVLPLVYMMYTGLSASTLGMVAGAASLTSLGTITRALCLGSASVRCLCVNITRTDVSASMKVRRSSGYDGSNGTKQPPARAMASMDTTMSKPRSMHRPTGLPGFTPACTSARLRSCTRRCSSA
jgi:hypothetical protein